MQFKNKSHIRKEVLGLRNNMTTAERECAAALLTKRICEHPCFVMSDTILAFVSYGSEVDTTAIIEEALRLGKKVYVPKVEGEDMNFYRIRGMAELVEGYKGIREPSGTSERYGYLSAEAEKVMLLMPGAVFDRKRNRIGYGKGFYDRFLADKEAMQLRTIGVGFRCQLMEEIPAEEWDIKPNWVICV